MKYFWRKCFLFMVVLVLLSPLTGENGFAMKVTIVTTTGKTFFAEVEPENKIIELKDFIFDVTRINVGTQRLYKDSVELKDNKTLASYNIAEGDTIKVKRGVKISSQEDKKSGGILLPLILILVLVVIVITVRKLFFTGQDEEPTEGES